MTGVEIERLKEELWQKKDREDCVRRQINQKLKQKMKDFNRLHQDHKHLDAEHKKLIVDGDRQQEKMQELRDEVNKMAVALAEERTKGVEAAKMLEEAAKDRMELTLQHHEETERAKMALNKVQTTYQMQLMHY